MAKYDPLGQTAISGLRGRAAQAGLENSPFALTSEAGLRGQLSNQAVQDAFSNALQTSIAGANLIAGQQTPAYYGSPLATAAQTGLNIYGLGGPKAFNFNFSNRTPYYPAAWGAGNSPNILNPNPSIYAKTEGTPIQYPYYTGGR